MLLFWKKKTFIILVASCEKVPKVLSTTHRSFFCYDNDSGLQGPFCLMLLICAYFISIRFRPLDSKKSDNNCTLLVVFILTAFTIALNYLDHCFEIVPFLCPNILSASERTLRRAYLRQKELPSKICLLCYQYKGRSFQCQDQHQTRRIKEVSMHLAMIAMISLLLMNLGNEMIISQRNVN